MTAKALVGSLLGSALAAVSVTVHSQPKKSDIPSAAIQDFLINARDRQCIAIFSRGPGHGAEPFETEEIRTATGHEYLVSGRGNCFCSPTGNCAFWVVIPSASTFRVLLRATAQDFTVLPQITNGYPALELSMHASAFERKHRRYRFDGVRYRIAK